MKRPLLFFAAVLAFIFWAMNHSIHNDYRFQSAEAEEAESKEYLYRMSAETHDRWLREGLSWWHYWGQPEKGEDPEDFLIRKASWGRLNSLKEAGFTREVIY